MKKARSSTEQNVIAYQQQTDILFITCKTIESGKELLYWYSKGYAKRIGRCHFYLFLYFKHLDILNHLYQ